MASHRFEGRFIMSREESVKLSVIRTKASLLGASGLLTLGAGAGIAVVAHPAMAAPTVTTPDPGDTVEVVEGLEAPAAQSTEAPAAKSTEAPAAPSVEAPATSGADAPGGHADPAGANVDNQHQGQGESDG
jgi:hypothetical protein